MSKKVYALEEHVDGVVRTFFFKTKKLRDKFYENNLICDFGDHYRRWLECHDLKESGKTWKQYLNTVQPEDNYVLLEGELTSDLLKSFVYSDKKFEKEMICIEEEDVDG